MYRLIKLVGFIIGTCIAGEFTCYTAQSEESEVAKYSFYLLDLLRDHNMLGLQPILEQMWEPLKVRQLSSGSSETLLSIGDEEHIFLTLTLQDHQFKVEVDPAFEEYIHCNIAEIQSCAMQMKSKNSGQKIEKIWPSLTETILKYLIFRRIREEERYSEAIEYSNGLNTVFLKVYRNPDIKKIKLRISGAIGFMPMLGILEVLARVILDENSHLLDASFVAIREHSSQIISSLIQHKIDKESELLGLQELELPIVISDKGLKVDIGDDTATDTASVAASTQIFSMHSDVELAEEDTQTLRQAILDASDSSLLKILLNLDKAIKFGKGVLGLEDCNEKLDLSVGAKVLELAYKRLKETGIDAQPSESFGEMIKSIQKFSDLLSSCENNFTSLVETLYDLTKHMKDLDQAVYFHLLQTLDQRIQILPASWEEEPEHESTCQDSDSVANMADFDEDPVDTVDEKVDQYIQTTQPPTEQLIEFHSPTTAESQMDDKLIFIAIFLCVICALIFIQLVCMAIKISTNSIENEVIIATAAAYTNLLDLFPVV